MTNCKAPSHTVLVTESFYIVALVLLLTNIKHSSTVSTTGLNNSSPGHTSKSLELPPRRRFLTTLAIPNRSKPRDCKMSNSVWYTSPRASLVLFLPKAYPKQTISQRVWRFRLLCAPTMGKFPKNQNRFPSTQLRYIAIVVDFREG